MTSIDYLVRCISELEYAYVTKQIDSETYGKYYREDIDTAKEMHHKELMESMQKGMELQEKENNRIGFRERNGLLPQQKILDEEIEKRVKEVGAMGEYYKWGYKDAII